MRPEGLRESERESMRERETDKDPANQRKGRRKWKMDDDKQRKARERPKKGTFAHRFSSQYPDKQRSSNTKVTLPASVSMTTPWATSGKHMKDIQRRYFRRANKAIPIHLTPGLSYTV